MIRALHRADSEAALASSRVRATRTRRLVLALLLTLTLLPIACVSAPPFEARGEVGVVRSHRRALGIELRNTADRFVADLRERVPGIEPRPVKIWVQKEIRSVWGFRPNENVTGYRESLGNRIYLLESSSFVGTDLCHELVHATLGPDWDDLPPAIEEGLCDQLADRLGRAGPAKGPERALLASAGLDGTGYQLRVRGPEIQIEAPFQFVGGPIRTEDLNDVFSRSSLDVHPLFGGVEGYALYGLGWFVVGQIFDRHGIAEGSRRLLESSALSESESRSSILDAAGLTSGRNDWNRVLEGVLIELAPAVATSHADTLARAAAQLLKGVWSDDYVFEFIVEGADYALDLRELPAFVEALRQVQLDD